MGCRSSKPIVSESVQSRPSTRLQSPRDGQALGHNAVVTDSPKYSAAEKRARAAEAAETRQGDWRQGGHADPDMLRTIGQRRKKDELLATIYNRYTTLGREPPIGLPSCELEQLQRHLETLR
ncbi:hypothetical protein KXD40_007115 [Peronospora effusa]|uniref:Uncharacterized protein n=1 Tax=Peronospora effusa TaxID=542832 RepID=A0A3M6VCU8_9STRA|nr:hypothetical protein DD238_004997 [Peronospora effusa]RQM13006.1 hypothetical protein DD237_005807 [Peronospora effusa]UIZ24709.1 hypothetical protein KXD40_007115 [Peronospora effusa]CAI5700696.1 unnamed protein product [Peronospora effusa]